MATATYGAQQKDVGQSAHRRPQIWKDQHGRSWHSSVDDRDKAQHPASPLEALGWTAPVVPPQQYITVHPERMEYGKILVDYERWARDLSDSLMDRARALEVLAMTIAQGDEQLKNKLIDQPTSAMLHALGPSALRREYPLACAKGDPWALGLTDVMPAWAKKVWPNGEVLPTAKPAYDYSFLDAQDAEASAALKTPTKVAAGVIR